MRTQSAAAAKGNRMGRGRLDRPDPESKSGHFFAALMSGERIKASDYFGRPGQGGVVIERLRSIFGMEIESGRNGCKLLGEWDGPYFVPVERMRPYPEPEDYRQPKN